MSKILLSYKLPLEENIPISITGSKSETNRLLILQGWFPNLEIKNSSASDDSVVLKKGLAIKKGVVDVHHAGTAMRFLTAYFSVLEDCEVVLTGSSRMKERPIGILVEALKNMGASISYAENEGFPPLKIKGKKLDEKTVSIDAHVSSQYISALMLIGAKLDSGLCIKLKGITTSLPYIKMTAALLNEIGINCDFSENSIAIAATAKIKAKRIVVESDWSSASYFYSIVALSEGVSITLGSYKKESLQGDSELACIYESLGVSTLFNSTDNTITLSKNENRITNELALDLTNTPDIAQTIAVTCFGLGISCHLSGLHTLKIKETDRLLALQTELTKLNAMVTVTEDSLQLKPSRDLSEEKPIAIDTYNDHRMAMAFAPLAIKMSIAINDPDVVTKSFPSFWKTLEKVGITSKRL